MVGAYLTDPAREILRPVAGYHVPPALLEKFLKVPFRLETNPYIADGWRTQQIAWCRDAQTDPRSDPELTKWIPMRSVVFCPLTARDAPIGALFLIWWMERDAPTPVELSLLEGIASQTSLAVENARLFERMERSLHETQALLAVTQSFSEAHDVGEIMRRVCREATRALGADSAVFYTVDEEQDRVVPVAGYRIPAPVLEYARTMTIAEVPPVFTDAFRSRRIVFVRDAAIEAPLAGRAFEGLTLRSMLLSPVHSKDHVFGSLILYWWNPVSGISDGDLELLAALSAQAALALENGRLLAETKSHAAALREKNAELDSFVYTVSHDLKSPLVTIQGMAELVLEEHTAGLDAQGRHYLERIRANTGHMERLLLDLLALSRVGREARPPEAVDLTALVDDLLIELAEPLRGRGITVTVDRLPRVWAIRVQMEQVWRNLLTNAVKYMGDGPRAEIEIGGVDHGAFAECWIRDTGIGIDPAYHKKVFEIFQRLKDVEAEGTGVGLPIVKKIVEAAGGHIGLESARGHGSTFRFTWPRGPRS
jgi:signal transduction histidine kinase